MSRIYLTRNGSGSLYVDESSPALLKHWVELGWSVVPPEPEAKESPKPKAEPKPKAPARRAPTKKSANKRTTTATPKEA